MSSSLTAALEAASVIASWRGVTFTMINSSDTVGRRVVQYLFPGVDDSDFPDLGALDGPIQVRGLIIGDDYIIRAGRMRTALLAAGSGTLVHPWWGELTCVLLQPGRIEFDDAQIRVARFEATFIRVPSATTASTDSLSALLTAADALVDAAEISMQQILAPVVIGLSLASALSAMVTKIGAIWDEYLGSAPETVSSAAASALVTLQAGYALPSANTDTTFADSVTDGLVGVPAAIANAVADASPAAIASASTTASTSDTVDPSTATQLLLDASADIAAAATSYSGATLAGSAALVIGLAACTATMAQAIAASSSIDYASQTDALAWRDKLTAGVATVQTLVTAASNTTAAVQALSTSWSALRAAEAAIVADISSLLGRLPVVVTLTIPTQMSAWLIAYSVAGDDLTTMVDVLEDMVTRNGIRNPGTVPAGTVEVLEQST